VAGGGSTERRWSAKDTSSSSAAIPGTECALSAPLKPVTPIPHSCGTHINKGGARAHCHTVIYDQMSMSRQLGLMPAMDSVQVKAMVGLQRAQALGRKLVRGARR
jgi:hypothetical protein